MERSGNFYKAIQLGYILISILIGCMAYNSLYEWQEIEALELGNKKIDELRKEINNINIQMIKFSLLGETILEWNDKDIEHYHARRMAMDSMLCRFVEHFNDDRVDTEIRCALYNRRGMTSRSPFEGGTIERNHIQTFMKYRDKARYRSSPRLTHIFECLIKEYQQMAEKEDNEAKFLDITN